MFLRVKKTQILPETEFRSSVDASTLITIQITPVYTTSRSFSSIQSSILSVNELILVLFSPKVKATCVHEQFLMDRFGSRNLFQITEQNQMMCQV